MGIVDGQTKDGSVHTDTFVLQMNYDPAGRRRQDRPQRTGGCPGRIDPIGLPGRRYAGTPTISGSRPCSAISAARTIILSALEPWNGDMTLGDWGVNTSQPYGVGGPGSQQRFCRGARTLHAGLLAAGPSGLPAMVGGEGERRNPLRSTEFIPLSCLFRAKRNRFRSTKDRSGDFGVFLHGGEGCSVLCLPLAIMCYVTGACPVSALHLFGLKRG